jgi:excisionase family DNA binding protein
MSTFPAARRADRLVGIALLTLDEAAQELRCSRRTIERRIAAGRLHAFKDAGTVRIGADELRRYVAAHTGRSRPAAVRPMGRILAPGERLW